MDALAPVADPASLRAYRAIERAIVTLELAPGSVTTERRLIERFDFGRTPVREAIQRLAWEGFVEVRPRSGLAVAPLHGADWRQVIEARTGVEIVLARGAARNGTPESESRFQSAARSMHDAVLKSDVAGFLEADKALDEALAFAAENPFAARVAAPLQTHSRRFWYRFQRTTGLAEAAERHVSLIDRILDRDEAGAAAEAGRLMLVLGAHAQAVLRR